MTQPIPVMEQVQYVTQRKRKTLEKSPENPIQNNCAVIDTILYTVYSGIMILTRKNILSPSRIDHKEFLKPQVSSNNLISKALVQVYSFYYPLSLQLQQRLADPVVGGPSPTVFADPL